MSEPLLEHLKTLISLPGLSGHEAPIREAIRQAWQPLVDEFDVSRLGSLHGLKRGRGADPRPSLVVMAHMDGIGMMVTEIVDGFLRFTEIGGIDPRVLPGQMVTIHGTEDLPGLVVLPQAHLLPTGKGDGGVDMEYLLIDTGLLPRDVARKVKVGDLVSYAQSPLEVSGGTLVGHTLDNRASVAVVTHFLKELQSRPHAWDVWAVASTQEEETLGGAKTSAFQLQPQLAVVLDVTFASSPGSPSHRTYPMGKGPTIGWGPNVHPALFQHLKNLAEKLEIPYAIEVMPRHSGTDAFAVQVVAAGIPCALLGIPLRYMHTPVEMIAMKDIERAGRLLAEFVAGLEPDFVQKITWDDGETR